VALGDYLPILFLLGVATLFGVASIVVASRVGPFNPTPAKVAPYECGLTPERLPRERFPVKFYVVAMLFIIFDIEVIFFFPFAVLTRELGLFGLAEMGVFILLVFAAYLYVWRGGGFDWEEEERARWTISRAIVERARQLERRLSA
jgi:NADH-quinone oxidoreductase subunit A